MNRPNGEQSGFGSSRVFSIQREALKHAYDCVALFFSKLWGLVFLAVRNGEVSRSCPSGCPFLGEFWEGRWEFLDDFPVPGAQSRPGRFTVGSAAACPLSWALW